MKKDYWIDADVDGTPRIGSWQADNKIEARTIFTEFYKAKGVPEREIIIRNIKQKTDYGQLTVNALRRMK